MTKPDFHEAQRTLAIDFDGVLHRYSLGWSDGTIYDNPVTGVEEALEKLHKAGFKLVCLTTREPDTVAGWLTGWDLLHYFEKVTNKKIPAIAYIDDRAIRFTNWDDITKMFC